MRGGGAEISRLDGWDDWMMALGERTIVGITGNVKNYLGSSWVLVFH